MDNNTFLAAREMVLAVVVVELGSCQGLIAAGSRLVFVSSTAAVRGMIVYPGSRNEGFLTRPAVGTGSFARECASCDIVIALTRLFGVS